MTTAVDSVAWMVASMAGEKGAAVGCLRAGLQCRLHRRLCLEGCHIGFADGCDDDSLEGWHEGCKLGCEVVTTAVGLVASMAGEKDVH